MKARILIVGGGVMGTSIATRCAQRTDPLRAPVVLFEKSGIGAGSSGRAGAILRQFYRDSELAVMARNSIREYASFEARTGRSIGFTRTGVLTLAGPKQKDWRQRIEETVATLAELGIEVSLVEGSQIREIFPAAKVRKGTIAAWEPHAGFVEPSLTLSGFAALARNYGAVTRLGVTVEEVKVEGGRVVGARTSEGDYEADQVVLVAGPWVGGLLEGLGVDIPLRILRSENHFVTMPMSDLEPEEEEEHPSGISFDIEDLGEKSMEGVDSMDPRGIHPTLIDLEHGFYCRCEPLTRSTRIGRTDYEQ